MWWLVTIAIMAASWGLAQVARADSVGGKLYLVTGCVLVLAICWRMFERLLHVRFPTKREHTVAGKYAAVGAAGVLLVQGVVVLIGK